MAPSKKQIVDVTEKEIQAEEPPKVSFSIPSPPKEDKPENPAKKQVVIQVAGTQVPSPVKGPNGEDIPPCFFVDFDPNSVGNQQAYIPAIPVANIDYPGAGTGAGLPAQNNPTGSSFADCPPSVVVVVVVAFILFLVGAILGASHRNLNRKGKTIKKLLKEATRAGRSSGGFIQEGVDSDCCMGVSTDEEEAEGPASIPRLFFMTNRFDVLGTPPIPKMVYWSAKRPMPTPSKDAQPGQSKENIDNLESIEANIPQDPAGRAKYFESNFRNIINSIMAKIEECFDQTSPAEMQAWYEWYEEQERLRKKFPGMYPNEPYVPAADLIPEDPPMYYDQPPKYDDSECLKQLGPRCTVHDHPELEVQQPHHHFLRRFNLDEDMLPY